MKHAPETTIKPKEWYRNWWGLIILVFILPFFVVWYVWSETKWSKNIKIIVTIAAIIFLLIELAALPTLSTPTPPAYEAPKQAPKQEAPKQDTSELGATVQLSYDVPGVEVTNNEKVGWDTCKLKLNSDYKREISGTLAPNSPLNNPYGLFTKDDGTRFDNRTTKPKNLFISCKVNGATRSNYYEFK